jgi:hypothetical protein
MPKYKTRGFASLAMAGLLWINGAGIAHAQFTQNKDKIKIDLSTYPPEMRKAYGAFSVRCGECHGLDTSLKPSFSPAQWTIEVKRMHVRLSKSAHLHPAHRMYPPREVIWTTMRRTGKRPTRAMIRKCRPTEPTTVTPATPSPCFVRNFRNYALDIPSVKS